MAEIVGVEGVNESNKRESALQSKIAKQAAEIKRLTEDAKKASNARDTLKKVIANVPEAEAWLRSVLMP